MNTSLQQYLSDTPLKELSEVFELMSARLWQERQENQGFIPREIFNAVMGMGGAYTTVIAVPRIKNSDGQTIGYAHKLREVEDDGFVGYYHQPGTLVRVTQPDPYGDALIRLTSEFFGKTSEYSEKKITEIGFATEQIPLSFVWEVFRKSLATRIAFFVDIPEEVYQEAMAQGSGKEWVLVDNPHTTEENIIPFELAWLRFAVAKERKEGVLILPEEDVIV